MQEPLNPLPLTLFHPKILSPKSCILLILLILLWPFNLQAAKLNFTPPLSTVIKAGDEFDIEISGDFESENINSIEGRLRMEENIAKIENINLSDSIINYWVLSPNIAEISTNDQKISFTEIAFSGVLLDPPQGIKGGKIFTIHLTALYGGNLFIELYDARAVLNDGKGTLTNLSSAPFQFEISGPPKEKVIEEEKIIKEEVKEEEFIPAIDQEVPIQETKEEKESIQEEETEIPEKEIAVPIQKKIAEYKKEQSIVKKRRLIMKDFDKPATKCEFVVMNGRAADWKINRSQKKSRFFKDLNDLKLDWCVPYADYAFQKGFIKGRSNKIFGAEGHVNRFEVAVIIARQIAKGQILPSDQETIYDDDKEIVAWARGAINYLAHRKIITGFFNPKTNSYSFGGNKLINKIDAAIIVNRTFYKNK